jgi:hypothetical protein
MKAMLLRNPNNRPKADECLNNNWFDEYRPYIETYLTQNQLKNLSGSQKIL